MERRKRQTRAPMDDEAIIELYWARDESAVEETDVKYGRHLYALP